MDAYRHIRSELSRTSLSEIIVNRSEPEITVGVQMRPAIFEDSRLGRCYLEPARGQKSPRSLVELEIANEVHLRWHRSARMRIRQEKRSVEPVTKSANT